MLALARLRAPAALAPCGCACITASRAQTGFSKAHRRGTVASTVHQASNLHRKPPATCTGNPQQTEGWQACASNASSVAACSVPQCGCVRQPQQASKAGAHERMRASRLRKPMAAGRHTQAAAEARRCAKAARRRGSSSLHRERSARKLMELPIRVCSRAGGCKGQALRKGCQTRGVLPPEQCSSPFDTQTPRGVGRAACHASFTICVRVSQPCVDLSGLKKGRVATCSSCSPVALQDLGSCLHCEHWQRKGALWSVSSKLLHRSRPGQECPDWPNEHSVHGCVWPCCRPDHTTQPGADQPAQTTGAVTLLRAN